MPGRRGQTPAGRDATNGAGQVCKGGDLWGAFKGGVELGLGEGGSCEGAKAVMIGLAGPFRAVASLGHGRSR